MNGLVWIAQLALATIFLTAGTMRLFAFAPMVQAFQGWAHGSIPLLPTRAKLIGIVEVALAFGVMMPDVFTPDGLVPEYLIIRLSAAGLALLMVGAAIYHMRRKEPAALAVSIFLLALFVIVGRS
ncbi:MAG: DoxX family protein [Terracidiphilus sp.]